MFIEFSIKVIPEPGEAPPTGLPPPTDVTLGDEHWKVVHAENVVSVHAKLRFGSPLTTSIAAICAKLITQASMK